MKRLVLDLPDSVDVDEQDAKNMLAANLFQRGKLSLGQAAELAGFSKRAFMEILAKFNISLFNLTEEDIENDIANAKGYHI